MSEFRIYSSSAGSGKTYTLTKTYLKLLLSSDDPYYFRQILAVTFTNDAAAEMKRRILDTLRELGKSGDDFTSPLKESLLAEISGMTEALLQKRSAVIFHHLLEDYGDFQVRTIDSFVNQLVSTFSRDLNLPFNYEIVLDKDPVLLQAVDRVFDRIGQPEHEYLTDLIIDFAMENADEGRNWKNIRQNLADFAKDLFNDQYFHLLQKNAGLAFSDYQQIKKQIDRKNEYYREKYIAIGAKGQVVCKTFNLQTEDFSYGKGGFAGLFEKTLDPDNDLLNKEWNSRSRVDAAVNSGKFYSDKAAEAVKAKLDAASESLIAWFHELDIFLEEEKPHYLLLKEIRKNLNNLSLLEEVNHEFQIILTENNQAYITDFNRRINALIAAEPVPYIFERLGEKFSHILIDEFQDTSDIQFYNMLPLIENSLAKGSFNMLVGDPKQSIYRWRGGKVDLMLQLMNRDEAGLHDNPLLSTFQKEAVSNSLRAIEKSSLQQNFRSTSEIIAFNNVFFTEVLEQTPEPKIKQALEDVLQLPHDKTIQGGFVTIKFFPDSEPEITEKSWMLEQIHERINEGIKAGFGTGDIAILCRKKKHAALIATYLANEGYEIRSADSLLLKNSTAVRFIISLFEAYTDPAYSSLALLNYYQFTRIPFPPDLDYGKTDIWEHLRLHKKAIDLDKLRSFGLYQMTESLIQTLGIFDPGPHLPYVFSFLDLVQEFAKNKGNDLRAFLKHWNQIKDQSAVEINNPDAITVSTIHKSKGLEFPLVILPYAHWDFKPTNSSPGWYDLEQISYPELVSENGRLKAAPLSLISKTMGITPVADQREKELELHKLEEINSLYVALTRPVEQLHILSKKPARNQADSVYQLLQDFAGKAMKEENGQYVFARDTPKLVSHSKTETTAPYVIKQLTSKENLGNIRIQSNLELLFNQNNQRDRGILIHTLFSEIRVASDLSRALTKLKTEGLITENEKEDLRKEAESILQNPELQPLFTGNIRVENERDILTKNAPASRPDRVVHHQNGLTIMDYKTGVAKESHARQLRHYGELYRQMGFERIELLLIYFNPTRLVPVNF